MYILGISAFYHDSAACLVKNGEIISAVQEERFTRKKHDHSFPSNAINFCLENAGISGFDLDYVAFYDKPFLKFERILETYLSYAPIGIKSFLKAIPIWIKKKLWIKDLIKKELDFSGTIIFPEHHESHAASAFFPSPFQEAAFITMDGVGEWPTTSFGIGKDNHMQVLADIQFPHSLGLLYSAFTYYTGFRVNSGEYKIMGLAPYGEPKYKDMIYQHLIDVKDDGSFKMNMNYFDYCAGLTMTNSRFHNLFGGPPRKPESRLTKKDMDLTCSIQKVTEEIVLKMATHVKKETGKKYLCLAGGVALNCVANGNLLRENIFDDIWIQPAAGDAGGAVGAALFTWYQYLGNHRKVDRKTDFMKGAYLGPEFDNGRIESFLTKNDCAFQKLDDDEMLEKVAALLADEKIIGWFQGKMEFGPRALGARSIIGDARSPKMQQKMNLKIKFRESFRPFAPSVLKENLNEYFEIDRESPYMLLVANIKKDKQIEMTAEQKDSFGLDKLNVVRSEVPAITHVDYSARVQSVNAETNPLYHKLISKFNEKYGCSVIVNTSFNVRGEPIVCSPEDAYLCFMRTDMDYLIMANCLLDKSKQETLKGDTDWRSEFELD
jgi:carbamoyltransferase